MGASCVRPPGLFSLGMKMMISISRADWLVRLLMTKRKGRKVPPTNEAEPQEEEEEEAKKEKHLMASQVGGMLTNSPIILSFLLSFRLCGFVKNFWKCLCHIIGQSHTDPAGR